MTVFHLVPRFVTLSDCASLLISHIVRLHLPVHPHALTTLLIDLICLIERFPFMMSVGFGIVNEITWIIILFDMGR